jgi:hypothetical protein
MAPLIDRTKCVLEMEIKNGIKNVEQKNSIEVSGKVREARMSSDQSSQLNDGQMIINKAL